MTRLFFTIQFNVLWLNWWLILILSTRWIPIVSSATSNYSSALTTTNPTYARPGGGAGLFYYEAIQVTISVTGNYTFRSNSNTDMYGYFYYNSFDPLNSSLNLLANDDDSGGNLQFLLTVSLQTGRTYILVATTYDANVTTSFSITRSGPIATIILSTISSTQTSTKNIPVTSVAVTTVKQNQKMTSQRMPTSISGCSPPTITLIPNTTSLANPASYRKSQDFSISSNMVLSCTSSLAISVKWTIGNCSSACFAIQPNQSIITTSSELFISARTLDYGTYELKVTVQMLASSNFNSSISAYVTITRSGITANLVPLGTSIVTSGRQTNLTLNPGSYSIDPDAQTFNASDWNYVYYCRPYDLYDPTSSVSIQILDQLNHPCFLNRAGNGTAIQYAPTQALKFSVIILAGSLTSNQTYQFVVYMINRRNLSSQATGYVVVNIEDTKPQLIAVACVISTMCSPNLEYQFVNPTTQVALFSICIGNCTSLIRIKWNIYEGALDSLTNIVRWSSFTRMNSSNDNRVFGMNTSNLTVTNNLFLDNSLISYWRFEAMYSFVSENSTSALNFIINQPPRNGSCSIDPFNGTTTTLFTIICSSWFDEDGIKDYSVYVWTSDPSKLMMLASSPTSRIGLRLPAGDVKSSMINIIVQIRDMLNCVTQFDISSIIVVPDSVTTAALINVLQQPGVGAVNSNPVIQLLSGGDPNTVGQVLTSISQVFNDMSQQNLGVAVASGVPAASITISPLGSAPQPTSSTSPNASALADFNQQLNQQANVLDYLVSFSTNLPINTAENIKLQSSTLAKFTETTNQLTRKTSLLVSTKCCQLGHALQSMASRISYEDVQIAATQIAQCATNVLSAVNGPLQERGNTLDLDFTRANAFPVDYDTDLESDWSNPRLFADGNQFSWEAIQHGRNNYYQRQQATVIAQQVSETLSSITAALNIHLNIGQSMTMNTASVFVSLETATIHSLSNKLISQVGNGQIRIPSIINSSTNPNSSVSLRSVMQPLASADNSRSETNTNLSTTISFSVLDENGNDISIRTNLDQPIELIIPRDPNVIIPLMNLQNVTTITKHNQSFYLHYTNLTRKNNLTISFHLEMHPFNTSLAYLFIYNFDHAPSVNQSIDRMDGWTLFCPSNLDSENVYNYFIDNQRVGDHQSIVYGLRELNSIEREEFCSNNSMTTNLSLTFGEAFNFTSDYEIRTYTSGCYYLDSNNHWQSDGLIVGSLTNHRETQCFSTHLTTFAGGFLVLPAPVNWNYVFSNADFIKNKTIYLTVIFIIMVLMILMIYSRYKDRKDTEKLGVTPLLDNHKVDRYFYQIIVFTGHRKDSGTKSKVHFVLGGDDDETGVRTFTDRQRQILQRGEIGAFIMAVAGDYQKQQFGHVLSKQAYHSLSEGHLWFSIFSRPPSNTFTRVQRCTCCFVLLFITMLLNILYYDQSTELKSSKTSSALSIGPIHITSEQIGTGIFVELLSLMPSLLLVQLFRRSKQRLSKENELSLLQRTLINLKGHQTSDIQINKKKKTSWKFPWWCLYVAYGLSFLFIGISIFFIMIRGIEFGDSKIQKWLISLIIGFFSSICLTQPIKVVSLAIFFAFFIRTSKSDKEIAGHVDDDDQLDLADDEEYLHSIERKSLFINRLRNPINRLDKIEVNQARYQRRKEIQIWTIIRQISSYLGFLWILYLISYSNRNDNAFLQVKHMRNFFLNNPYSRHDYRKITTINDYWKWLEESFVEKIRAQQWYNDDPPRNLSGFIDDKSNRLIGWATMRQLRIKTGSCRIQPLFADLNLTCESGYSLFNEERRAFQPEWINQTTGSYHSSIQNAFVYKTAEELDAYAYVGDHETYSSGGYVYEYRGRLSELRSNLSELHRLQWIDERTRVVIIQLTLYNANVELFTSVILLAEFLSTGGVFTSARFEPLNFQDFTSLFQLLMALIYMSFIVYFMFVEIRSFLNLKWKYFNELWSYIEWGMIVCSWSAVGIFLWRYQEMTRISDRFRKTNGYAYVNLQLAAYVDNILVYLFGFCCFFGSIKCLRFSRYNRRVALFADAIQYASKDLFSFTMMFLIMFMAFVALFYLLFTAKIWACSTFLQTIQMLFETILMKFNTTEISAAHRVLGPLTFTLFIFFVVFIGMTMFISIISDSFRIVRNNLKFRINEDHDLFALMWKTFLRWTGIKKLNKWEQYEERDAQMRSEYYDPIERFPEKMDRLLEMFDRIYQTQLPPGSEQYRRRTKSEK